MNNNNYRVLGAIASAFLLTMTFLACRPSPGFSTEDCELVAQDFGVAGTVDMTAEVFASGLEIPWGIAWLPSGDMLVTERTGALRRVGSDGVVVTSPIANVPITSSGEGGLLGIALHPDFVSNRWFYLYYTANGTGGSLVNQVERWILSADGMSATADTVIVSDIPVFQYHNGGRIKFGADGYLYIGTGDAGVPALAQNINSLAGKILRVADDGSLPADNPFAGSLTWASGVRNTQAFDWLSDGSIVMADHGPSGLSQEGFRQGHDELNLVAKGDNLGWPGIYACETQAGQVSPVMTWADAMPPGGLAVYTGTEIPEWQGDVFIAVLGFDAGTPHLHRIHLDNGKVTVSETYLRGVEGYGRLREVIMGPDGGLYVTTSNCDGRGTCGDGDKILRIGRPAP